MPLESWSNTWIIDPWLGHEQLEFAMRLRDAIDRHPLLSSRSEAVRP